MAHDSNMLPPRPQPGAPFLNLPSELIELTIVYGAALSPVSVSAIAQTCRALYALVYGATDQHLWREVFLTTFDDPRLAEKADRTDPHKPYRSDYDKDRESESEYEAFVPEKSFDWRGEFCERVWSLQYIQRVTATQTEEQMRSLLLGKRTGQASKNVRAMQSLLSVVSTALPSPPTVVISFLSEPDTQRGDSSLVHTSRLPIFPPSPAVCTSSSISRNGASHSSSPSDPRSIAFGYNVAKNIRWLETAVANGYPPELSLRVSGRDLPGGSQGVWDDELEAREMHTFSRLLCYTGFIPIPQIEDEEEEDAPNTTSAASTDPTEEQAGGSGTLDHEHAGAGGDENDDTEIPEDEAQETEVIAEEGAIGTTLTYASAAEPEDQTDADPDAYEARAPSNDPLPPSKLPMDVLSQKRRARRIARMRVYNMQYLTRERHWGPFLLPPSSKLKDKGADDIEVDFLNPILELFAEHDAGHPNHVHFDEDEDEDGAEEDEDVEEWLPMGEGDVNDEHDNGHQHHGAAILQFPPEPFPLPPLPTPNELYTDWNYLAAVRVVVEANLREAVRSEALSGLMWLDGLRRGSAPKAVGPGFMPEEKPTVVDRAKDKGKGKATDEVNGWDWAGVEGDWKRCVCWLDYRDLILHNLARQFNDPNLQEAVRIVPMRLRIASYSPCPIPGYAHRPTIHVTGETAGPAGSGSIRKMKGTVGVIADGSIRWNLFSCIDDNGPAEWVTEGVQIGEATSGMGVLGMWTGAQHERMDPLGPFWSWKVG